MSIPANPDLIVSIFAQNGTRTAPPQTDPSGFVNYNDGYGPDYEIDLNSGDTAAKGVERGVQNYLFGLLTEVGQFWQQLGAPPWYSTMTGGYNQGAVVGRVSSGGVWTRWRSMVANNVTDPNVTGQTDWEYIPVNADLLSKVAMPAGGISSVLPGGQKTELVVASADFNSFTTGTWEFASDAVANGSGHSPVAPGATAGAAAGMLQSKTWVSGNNTFVTQSYFDRNGVSFFRAATNGSFTAWTSSKNPVNYSVDSSTTVNLVQGNAILATNVIADNQEFWIKVSNANTGAVTVSPVPGVAAVPLTGSTYAALQGGELLVNSRIHIVYRADSNSYALVSVEGGVMTQGSASRRLHALNLGDSLDKLGIGLVTCTGNANAYVGTSAFQPYTSLVDGMIIKTHLSNSNTGPSTFNLDGLGNLSVLSPWGVALQGGEIVSGWWTVLQYSQAANCWVVWPVGGGNTMVRPATASGQAVNLGQWTNQRGAPGWHRDPDGTIFQWGQISLSGTTTSVVGTFPIAFPNAINALVSSDTGNTAWATGIGGVSASQFQIYVPSYYPVGGSTNQQKTTLANLNWWAIGY